MSDDDTPARRRPVQREHFLQVAVRQFFRDAVNLMPTEYQLFAFDSAQKSTDNQRARMVARGIVPGTPDCLICVKGIEPFWLELKSKNGTLSSDQQRLMAKLHELGHSTAVARNVQDVFLHARRIGIPMRPIADVIAADLDLKVAARIAKAEQRVAGAPGRTPKPVPRYSAGKRTTKRWAKAGLRV